MKSNPNPQNGVQAVQCVDGTVWTRAQVLAMAMLGTTGNDVLYGTMGSDILDGKGGTDYEQGNGGNDTFIFNAGYGHLDISEYDANPNADNVLKLGTGITESSVAVTSDGTSIILTIGSSGDRITLDYMKSNPNPQNGVQAVQFVDGTVWTRAQVLAMAMLGTTGNDVLYGRSEEGRVGKECRSRWSPDH